MRLRVTKREDGLLEMAVGGEGHTLLNLLQSSLLKNEDVMMAGYSKPHPLMSRAILRLNMREGKPPEEALLAAAKDAKARVNEFLTEFMRQVEELRKRE